MGFNANLTTKDICKRFHEVRGDAAVVFSASQVCWIGELCTGSERALLYPHTRGRGYNAESTWASAHAACPVFLNSGGYMGTAAAVRSMLEAALDGQALVRKKFGDIAASKDQALFTCLLARESLPITLDYKQDIFASASSYAISNPKGFISDCSDPDACSYTEFVVHPDEGIVRTMVPRCSPRLC